MCVLEHAGGRSRRGPFSKMWPLLNSQPKIKDAPPPPQEQTGGSPHQSAPSRIKARFCYVKFFLQNVCFRTGSGSPPFGPLLWWGRSAGDPSLECSGGEILSMSGIRRSGGDILSGGGEGRSGGEILGKVAIWWGQSLLPAPPAAVPRPNLKQNSVTLTPRARILRLELLKKTDRA